MALPPDGDDADVKVLVVSIKAVHVMRAMERREAILMYCTGDKLKKKVELGRRG